MYLLSIGNEIGDLEWRNGHYFAEFVHYRVPPSENAGYTHGVRSNRVRCALKNKSKPKPTCSSSL